MPSLVDLTLGAWALLELGVRVRESVRGKGRRDRDRGTRVVVALTLGVAIATAAAAHPLRTVAPMRTAGLGLMWLGLALRVWAISALGASFRTTVEVDRGQRVVSTGPYRWIRHPSYTGLLLIATGFGVASGAPLSVVVTVLLLLPALVWRIRVEEAELDRVLGDDYRAYESSTTARLFPRLW